jgi:small-conductance mechanosensitive channel
MQNVLAHTIAPLFIACLLFITLPSAGLGAAAEGVSSAPEQAAPEASVGTISESTDAPDMSTAGAGDLQPGMRAVFSYKWLHMLDKSGGSGSEGTSVMVFVTKVPGDLARVIKVTGGEKGFAGVLTALFISLVSIFLGWLVVRAVRRPTRKVSAHLEQITPPDDSLLSRFWAGFLHHLPALTNLILFVIVSILIFLLIGGGVPAKGRILFQLILGVLLLTRLFSLIGSIVFSPTNTAARLFPISDSLAKAFHRAFTIATSFVFSGLLFLNFIRDLGARSQTSVWMGMLIGTIVIGTFVYLTVGLREPVSIVLRKENEEEKRGWIKEQLAMYWHVPVLLYLFFVWFIWIGQEMTGTFTNNGSFLVSLIILPLYLTLSHAGRLIISAVVDSLGIGQQPAPDMITGEEEPVDEEELKQQTEALISKAHFVFKMLLIVSLGTWLLSLWGYKFPFAETAVRAIFESLVILSLAILLWRFTSKYIERKIEEATPQVEKKDDDDDNEFGGTGPQGRGSTLLPMVRKVLGTILILMVALIVLSSIGVNIGPLLAGAGVLGLAVGFGAQKLVSDILSGFFFLLDDAFRVGEYIQAGSIRGTVESITLRNVMLRHHLGMLQVVPHSDLGAVTNYMRGGIIIKFPLEFPYDTDVNKVRKIIKKVGQEMLEDEVLGEDFLAPIKSQGVYAITNSIMVIRVKFTAKPGKQFVIKREAFRRLTEAFNARGIYYAHRKVIVDIAGGNPQDLNEAEKTKLLEAGAAAALLQQQEEEALKKAQEEENKK